MNGNRSLGDIRGMREKRFFYSREHTLLVALLPIILLVTGFTIGCHPEKTDSRPLSTLKLNSDGFWEEERLIYHGIPARIMFRLDQSKAEDQASGVSNACWEKFEWIGTIANAFDPQSEISRINTVDKVQPISVSPDMFTLLMLSRNMFRLSGGGFDPTVFPLKMLWRTAEQRRSLPTQSEISEMLERTGFQKVHIMEGNGREVRFDNPRMQLDFGGIAKGYAVDKVREVLKASGVYDGMVQLGGEVSVFGNKGKEAWRIGIQHPTQLDAMRIPCALPQGPGSGPLWQ